MTTSRPHNHFHNRSCFLVNREEMIELCERSLAFFQRSQLVNITGGREPWEPLFYWEGEGAGPSDFLQGEPQVGYCIYVQSAGDLYRRALREGVQKISAPVEMSWGEVLFSVEDEQHRRWTFASQM